MILPYFISYYIITYTDIPCPSILEESTACENVGHRSHLSSACLASAPTSVPLLPSDSPENEGNSPFSIAHKHW